MDDRSQGPEDLRMQAVAITETLLAFSPHARQKELKTIKWFNPKLAALIESNLKCLSIIAQSVK